MTLTRRKLLQPFGEMVRNFPGQLRDHLLWYGAGIALLLFMGLANVYLQFNTNVEVTEMYEDPVAFAGLPLYIGVYTYLIGTMLIVAGALLIFAVTSAPNVHSGMKRFIVVLGAFLLWLGLDDIFMIHEWVGLRLAELINAEDVGYDRQWLEAPVFATYAVVWVAMVIIFARKILRTAWILLMLVFVAFGVSVVLDLWEFIPLVPQPTTRPEQLVVAVGEDMAKFAGSFFALAYAVNVAQKAVRGAFAESGDGSFSNARN